MRPSMNAGLSGADLSVTVGWMLGNIRPICGADRWRRPTRCIPSYTRGTDVTIGYLDPGSGSLIASAVVGGVAAAGVAVRQARHRITSRFSRKRGEAESTPPDVESEVDDPATTDA